MAQLENNFFITNKMTTCKTCGAEIAQSATVCPSCGAHRFVPLLVSHPVGGTLLLIFLFCLLALMIPVLTSIEKDKTPADDTPRAVINAEEPIPNDPIPVTAPDTLGNWEITFNSFEVTEAISSGAFTEFKADDGNLYAVITLTVKNIGNEAHTFLPLLEIGDDIGAKIVYQSYEYSASSLIGYDDDLHYKQLNPLSSATGIIAFQIVKDVAESGELSLVLSCGSKTLTYELK